MSSAAHSWFLADDFSGALEVGAIWKKAGHPVDVVFNSSELTKENRLAGVSSETRNATEEDSNKRVSQMLKDAGGRRLVFKKIDSTLRGPVGAELDAVTQHYPDRPILFAPANPRAGREVKSGCLFVNGIPVSESSFATDLGFPVTDDSIQRIIRNTGGPAAAVVSFVGSELEDGGLRRKLEAGWKESQVLVVDSSTQKDLERVVAAARDVAGDFLPCGSGGLASAVVSVGVLSGNESGGESPEAKRGRILFVVGSLHPQSRDQIRYVANQADVPVEFVSTDSKADQLQHLLRTFRKDGVLILASQYPSIAERHNGPKVHRYREHLAELTHGLFASGLVDTLFVTGGETARAVIDRLDCQRLELETEFQPGVAVARMIHSTGGKGRLIVKPGGFGGPELLAQILTNYGKL